MAEEEVPLAVGEIYALRFWAVSESGHLSSVTQHGPPWHGDENVASCVVVAREEPRAPQPPARPVHPGTLSEPWPDYVQDPRRLVSIPGVQHQVLHESDHPNRFPEMRPGPSVTYDPYPDYYGAFVHQRLLDEYEQDLKLWPARWANYQAEVEQYEEALAAHREEVAEHIAPMPDCECGFYIVKDHKLAMRYTHDRPCFIGVVQAYGRVVPYKDGWRVGKARIAALAPWNCPVGEERHYRLRTMNPTNGMVYEVPFIDRMTEQRVGDVRTNYPHADYFEHYEQLLADWRPRLTR
jgi:hypothetical protein